MIELIQFPWSPYCLVQKRILEFAGVPYKTTDVPPGDRALVWRVTRQRYYQVPVLRDGRAVIFETDENSQVIAKYLDVKFSLGLFPRPWAGVQNLLWRHIDNDVEGFTFKLNDAHYKEFVPSRERLPYLRHKERKFGRGCIDQWRRDEKQLLAGLTQCLVPYEQMLGERPFLLDIRPRFVDFDLFGILENLLWSGHYKLPAAHPRLRQWHARMANIKLSQLNS